MKRRPAGSNSGDYQSAVARSDRSSFHVRLDVCKLFVLAYDQIHEWAQRTSEIFFNTRREISYLQAVM